MIVKKYGNRRLYDTEQSRYITLDELTERIREGAEVRVVDAKTGQDLTQTTLTQIIIEGRGAASLLPASLLHQMIRLTDDVLAEFFGRYLQGALELYLQARRNSQTFMPFNPFAALAQFATGGNGSPWGAPAAAPSVPSPAPSAPPPPVSDVEALRRELDELKRSLRKRKK